MTQETPVVVEEKAFREAYAMGYERFDGIQLYEGEEFDLAPFTDSAEYANHILPRLRALAGFEDSGYGTYTGNRDIVIVSESDLEDMPISGDLTESHYLYNELVDEFRNGAYKAVDNSRTVAPQ